MIIAKKYSKILANIKFYTNEEYLLFQISQLKHVFYSELSAIKNTKLEYIAFSDTFAKEFHTNSDSLGKRIDECLTLSTHVSMHVNKQEQKILNHKKVEDTLFYVKIGQQYIGYLMRKRALINPSTQDVVGLLILAAKLDLISHRRSILKYLSNKTYTSIIKPKSFTPEQHLILTCLILGFHQRKEIVCVLSKVTEHGITDMQVKHHLQALYKIYNCNNTHDLVDLISVDKGFVQTIPDVLIPDDSFPI